MGAPTTEECTYEMVPTVPATAAPMGTASPLDHVISLGGGSVANSPSPPLTQSPSPVPLVPPSPPETNEIDFSKGVVIKKV